MRVCTVPDANALSPAQVDDDVPAVTGSPSMSAPSRAGARAKPVLPMRITLASDEPKDSTGPCMMSVPQFAI